MKTIKREVWKKYFLGNKNDEKKLLKNWGDHDGTIILDDGIDYRKVFWDNWMSLFCDSFVGLIF